VPHDNVAWSGIVSASEIAAEPGYLDDVARDRLTIRRIALVGNEVSSKRISVAVSATLGGALGAVRLSIVIQKMRQLTMQKVDIRLTIALRSGAWILQLCSLT
jgi:hypothetical protein